MTRRTRLQVEALEDQTTPSTFTVVNLDDSGIGSLRQAILDANIAAGADAIHFAHGLSGPIALTSGQLNITDSLTIEGPGADLLAVSGSQQSRVFRISGGATVTIAALTITDGRAVGAPGEGGGILNVGSALALDRVNVVNNQAVGGATLADARGAGVANTVGGTLTVVDCLFTGNQSLGGARGRGFAAAILNHSSRLTVHHSTFDGNQAMGGPGGGPAPGGAISNLMGGATATITDSRFIGNQAIAGDGSGGIGVGRGGGVYTFQATATIENCLFGDNEARGGSHVTGNASVIGSGIGGAVFSGDAAMLFLGRSVIKGNQAIGGDGNTSTGGNGFVGAAFGGGLNNVGTATITDCLFEDNEARGGSGNRGTGVGVQFVGTGIGGGVNTNAGDPSGNPVSLTLGNVTLRHNRALGGDGNTAATFVGVGSGGGLASNGCNINIPVSSGSTTTLLNTTVEHNQAIGGRGGAGLGGGIANRLGGAVIVSGGTLSHNRAQGGDGGDGLGGGIYNGPASVHPSNFGAQTTLTILGSLLAHNAALGGASGDDGLGGGLYLGGTASVVDTFIERNQAIGGAGANGSEGGNGLGGGAYNDATSSLSLERCTISKNHANGGDGDDGGEDGEGIGGGVYNLGDFDFDAFTLFIMNHASRSHNDVFDPFA
jgi:hypothetical protein